MKIPVGAYVSVYDGLEFRELGSGEDFVLLESEQMLADGIEQGENRRGRWVKVPHDALDDRFRRVVTATWDGQRVDVTGGKDDTAWIAFNGSTSWARDHGLEGSQYDAFFGTAPVAELENVTVEHVRLPPFRETP